jgi:DNA topoisomerase I
MTTTTARPAVPVCRDGHGPMMRKHGRTGEFFSCSQYPVCRRTAPVPLELLCPRCHAPLVVRAAKKSGKRFTGCSRYPACEYVVWAEPHVCGRCGGACLGPEMERVTQAAVSDATEGAGHGRDADDDIPF